jgi:hypothetical protein
MEQFQIIKWKIPNCSKEWAENFEHGKEITSNVFKVHIKDGTAMDMYKNIAYECSR